MAKKLSLLTFLLIPTFVWAINSEQYLPDTLKADVYPGFESTAATTSTVESSDWPEWVKDRGKRVFHMEYLRDEYSYASQDDKFERTYRKEVPHKDNPRNWGMINLGMEHFLARSVVDFTVGGAFGLGLNQGRGMFAGSDVKSSARFSLWTIPFDLVLGMGLKLGRWMKLSVAGGPSIMGLIQTRSDKEDTRAEKKRRRQFSYGYIGTGRLQIALSDIIPKSTFAYYSEYNISKVYMNIFGRYQNYANFQDEDIAITGTSIGLGFSFEYF